MHWRCDVTESDGWSTNDFDDSSWSNAWLSPNDTTYNSEYLRSIGF